MSSESSSHVYRIDPLQGADNYSVWKIKMLDILTDLGYDSHIEDDAEAPEDSANATWISADRRALSTIRLRVSDGVLVYISSASSAKEAWSTLHTMYETKGPIGIVLARRKFFRAEAAADSLDIEPHIRLMRSYQSELHSLGQPITEEDFSITLLTSLPEDWNPFISSSIDEKLLMDSNKLVARILAEQQRLNEKASSSTALITHASRTQYPSYQTPSSHHSVPHQSSPTTHFRQAHCYKCGKIGHIARYCSTPPTPGTYDSADIQANVANNEEYDSDLEFAF